MKLYVQKNFRQISVYVILKIFFIYIKNEPTLGSSGGGVHGKV